MNDTLLCVCAEPEAASLQLLTKAHVFPRKPDKDKMVAMAERDTGH